MFVGYSLCLWTMKLYKQEHAHQIEIKTLKTLVKKQTVRVKELESQLETFKEASWNENNIRRENYERLEEELDY